MKTLIVLLVALVFVLGACGSGDDAGNGGPDEILNVEALRERASDLDGEVVTVRSNYWSSADGQYLSDILMESYPPQIHFDQSVVLHGEVPQSVLDMLTTAEPPMAQVTWGEVEVTGEVSVDGDEVHLEIADIDVVQA